MEKDFFDDDEIRKVLKLDKKPVKGYVDFNKKDVGDRVKIIDYSSMSYIDNQFDDVDYDIINTKCYYVVCDTKLKNILNTNFSTYIQDLIIANPITKILYKINSRHVKIVKSCNLKDL